MRYILYASRLFSLIFFLALTGCSPLIGSFSEQAYENATSLKARSVSLISLSGEEYKIHQDSAAKIRTDLLEAYEYSKGMPNNEDITGMWEILISRDRNLMGGFLRRWEEHGKIPAVVRSGISSQVSEAFDAIICLEVNKGEPRDCQI